MILRREFLKAVAVSVGVLIVGCGDDDGDNNANSLNNTNNTNACSDSLEPGTQFFPQSVASGDPSPSTVVLWTRVEDDWTTSSEYFNGIMLELQVALDADFTQLLELDGQECGLALSAAPEFDHCVKVRLTDLDAATHYYYRFVYSKDDKRFTSNVGRTKTAPADDADAAAKFAFVSCQDFNGKYFNAYKHLVQQDDVDFFVHLGDYVYETTGDPHFQSVTADRHVVFRDEADAIAFNEGTDTAYFAANTLSNYRDLYRTYRSDPWLQRAHELYPCIAIWDDHEFSNDCFGATSTYFDDTRDERDENRRKSANQAWFEFMPVDYLEAPDFKYDASASYGEDIRIFRDLRYGKNLHLVMTDLRSYRADHVVREDLFPGKVVLDEAALTAQEGALPAWADPYVDIDTYDGGSYATVLTSAADTVGYPASEIAGNLSIRFVNSVVEGVNEGLAGDMQIPVIDPAGLEAGLSGISIGKLAPNGSLGSRYFVVKEAFEAYARMRYAESNGASESTMGEAQEAWFLDTMKGTDATWKVWGNEFCLVQRSVDLSALAASVGPDFAKQFLLSAEDWDGMPNKRNELLAELSELDNVVAITGDIHAFFAGTPYASGDPSKRIVEFVTGAVSSGSMKRLLMNTANSDPTLKEAGAVVLAAAIHGFLFTDSVNPDLAYGNVDHQGYSIMELNSDELNCTFYQLPESNVGKDLDPDEVGDLLKVDSFRVAAGTSDLLTQIDGSEKRWDPAAGAWV